MLQIGDGSQWHFVNGAWANTAGGCITVPPDVRRKDETGIQGNHYAFHKGRSYSDVTARFEFRLASHSDVGIILRARDAAHFYVLHFPNCGQGSRAQHFWVAFSKMDDSGFLRRIKLEMIRRVPSNNGLWLPAEVTLRGPQIDVRVGRFGHFTATDSTYPDPGRLGLYAFMYGVNAEVDIRNLTVEGEPSADTNWRDGVVPRANWYYPQPKPEAGGWQRPADLLQFPDGELLLSYSEQTPPFKGPIVPLLTRSRDGGRNWSAPEPLEVDKGDSGWEPARIHLTPRGRLVSYTKKSDGYYTAESSDRGRTWSALTPANLSPAPPNLSGIHLPPQALLNLADGSMLMLGYGARPDLNKKELTIYTWGSLHCQAFASRSADDGRTWSPWVNIDNAGVDTYVDPAEPNRPVGRPIEGNLDLTETCAAQMGDGRIMTLTRPIYSPWMWESWSDDGGATWTPCVRGPFPGYATANMLRTRSGAVLVSHRLPTLTINVSHDDGATWDEGTLIDSGVWVMGGMVEVERDVVLYVYWDSFESLMRAQRLRVTRASLEPAD